MIKRKINVKNLIIKFNNKHKNKYDYSLVEYKSTNEVINIICPTHGIFEKRPKNHLRGEGCKKCDKIDTNKFIKMSIEKHGDKYDYSLSNYTRSIDFVKIICPIHGVFLQSPQLHLRGNGCRNCGKKYTNKIFIEKANKIHNHIYDYSNIEYKNSKSKISIVCKKHGIFNQTASDHLSGHGCISCGSEISVSKLESKWLDFLNIGNQYRQHKISKYTVDGFDPTTNTIYEFNGDFWHGNPNKYNSNDLNPLTNTTFGRLYKNTINREKWFIKNGYNVISIWESDYKLKYNS